MVEKHGDFDEVAAGSAKLRWSGSASTYKRAKPHLISNLRSLTTCILMSLVDFEVQIIQATPGVAM